MRLLHGHSGPVYALAFSPEGSRLATGGKDGKVLDLRLYSEASPRILHQPSAIWAIAYSASQDYLAVGGDAGAIVFSGDDPALLSSVEFGVACLAFCNLGQIVAVGSGDRLHP